MSDAHTPAAGSVFTEAEISEFHQSDVGACRVIVLLMTSIFLGGLALYTTVAIVVAS
jgi:hypothetical protein